MNPSAGGNYIGRSVLRREDDYLLRGKARFVDDLPEARDQLHLGFVMSMHAHASIVSIDTSEAKAAPGIVDVLTGRDIAKLCQPIAANIEHPGHRRSRRPVLASDKVRFVGEHVAVVLAENPYAAQDAIDLVNVDYAPLAVASEIEAALNVGAPLVHDHIPDNIVFEEQFATECFQEAMRSGDFVIKERFRSGRIAGLPIEPRGCLAVPDHIGDGLVFYSSTQIPHMLRTKIARSIGLAESRIRVVVPAVGGGFGTKAQVYPEEIIAAAIAMKYRRPVKWIQDRREELLTNIHARDNLFEIEAAVTNDGVIVALRVELSANAGAYSSYPFGSIVEPLSARELIGPYRIRNYAYRARAVATHTCPSGTIRGVGQPTCFMAIEGMMDRIGRRLDIDPAEVRLRNIIKKHDLPYVNAVGVRYDTGSYEASLRRALELADYNDFRRRQPADRKADGKYRGIGICNFTETTGSGAAAWRADGMTHLPGFDSALIRVEPTGEITAYISHASGGQGHLTTFAQIVAEHVGARLENVTIVEGDTGLAPYGTNTLASRSAVTGGGAAIRASAKIAAKLKRIAGHIMEAATEDIRLEGGFAHIVGAPEMKVSMRQIAETAYSINGATLPDGEDYGIEAVDYYDPPLATVANGVHIATVSVEPETGRVTIDDYVVVHDCGRMINPLVVDGQIQGGSVQGIGEALMEEVVYDSEGQHLNASLLEYLLPTALDVPKFRLEHIETPTIDAVGGFKGVGESGVIGALAAIVNAVADALSGIGANVNRVPLRPAYLRSLIREAQRIAR
jgi:carbon-monoxide dehydrogenase large subunit